MLERRKEPNAGLWNGVGGKIEPGERPMAAVIREVREETGVGLPSVRFGGVVTWPDPNSPSLRNGMYVYTANLPEGFSLEEIAPRETPEGTLRWLHYADCINPADSVVDNIHLFLGEMLGGATPFELYCEYQNSVLVHAEQRPMSSVYLP